MLQAKCNQPNLRNACIQYAATYTAADTDIQKEKGHGRIETRTVAVFPLTPETLPAPWNELLHTLIQVTRTTTSCSKKRGGGGTSTEIAYYLSTATDCTARDYAAIIRSHWGIENTHHYVRDMALGEDFSRVRKKPENVARLRSFALNLIRANGGENVSQELYRNALNVQRVLRYEGVLEEKG